jgi:hypothetical protein
VIVLIVISYLDGTPTKLGMRCLEEFCPSPNQMVENTNLATERKNINDQRNEDKKD